MINYQSGSVRLAAEIFRDVITLVFLDAVRQLKSRPTTDAWLVFRDAWFLTLSTAEYRSLREPILMAD